MFASYRLNSSIIAIAGACLCAVALFAAPAAALTTYELTGQHSGEHGEHGLWTGPDDWTFQNWDYFNFEWDNVDLSISGAGAATISGTMTRIGDAADWPSFDLSWGVDIQLGDIDFTGNVFDGVSSSYGSMVDDLLASAENGAGIEWGSLEMTITMPDVLPYASDFVEEGWIGLAIDGTGSGVAGLHYEDGAGLTFVAGLQNPSTDEYWYQVGASRTLVGEGVSSGGNTLIPASGSSSSGATGGSSSSSSSSATGGSRSSSTARLGRPSPVQTKHMPFQSRR